MVLDKFVDRKLFQQSCFSSDKNSIHSNNNADDDSFVSFRNASFSESFRHNFNSNIVYQQVNIFFDYFFLLEVNTFTESNKIIG